MVGDSGAGVQVSEDGWPDGVGAVVLHGEGACQSRGSGRSSDGGSEEQLGGHDEE